MSASVGTNVTGRVRLLVAVVVLGVCTCMSACAPTAGILKTSIGACGKREPGLGWVYHTPDQFVTITVRYDIGATLKVDNANQPIQSVPFLNGLAVPPPPVGNPPATPEYWFDMASSPGPNGAAWEDDNIVIYTTQALWNAHSTDILNIYASIPTNQGPATTYKVQFNSSCPKGSDAIWATCSMFNDDPQAKCGVSWPH